MLAWIVTKSLATGQSVSYQILRLIAKLRKRTEQASRPFRVRAAVDSRAMRNFLPRYSVQHLAVNPIK